VAASPSEADLEDLAAVLAPYQEVLERVKVHLRDLGFAPSGRVKTTTTMTDKLRRTRGMQLSRMQDLAGARFVVHDLAAQDEARDKISEFYAEQDCSCRVIDRRADPRFGYRAVHVVTRIDELPVEIQIRTELQDTWAQIVERLADRWGRGIRYGQDPEDPEGAIVSSGGRRYSRRDVVAELMKLSDRIWSVEQVRRHLDSARRGLNEASSKLEMFRHPRPDSRGLERKIDSGLIPVQESAAQQLAPRSAELDAEGQALLNAGTDITTRQLIRMLDIGVNLIARDVSAILAGLASREQQLRDTLQVIAGAMDEGA